MMAQGNDTYSDDMARLKFFPLAAAAYSDTPQHCIKNKFGNATVSVVMYNFL